MESSLGLYVFFIIIIVRYIIDSISIDGRSRDLNKRFWSVSEWSSPVVGWFWVLTISLMSSKFTVLSVMNIINVVSINISFCLI
jgi:hypothetical protein